jgi:L-histidine Nalpha-methyltransferase
MNNTITKPETKLFADVVLKGLSLKKKKLPSWLIYDTKGSEIFKQITELESYHPSRCELEIFHTHKTALSKIFCNSSNHLVELGSGDGDKTMILIEQLLADGVELQYTPIDISKGAISNLISMLNKKFPNSKLNTTGLVADYFEGIATISNKKARKMVLFLGVTLNNMDVPDAKAFLKKLRGTLQNEDYLLIGFDLMKSPKLLHQSYNDELFEKFNLHLLDRINDMLGANFDKKLFVQQGHYNPHTHAVESYLYSTCKQTIHIEALDKGFDFVEWETLQTEQSYKYSIEDIKSLALESGFKISENFFDSNNYFVDSLWQASK